MKQGKGRRGRKVGNNAKSPARQRYWATGRLMRRKVRALMRQHKGWTFEEARTVWERARKGRVRREAPKEGMGFGKRGAK